MDYIIHQAKINSYGKTSSKSFLIQKNKIAYIGNELRKYKQIRMDVSTYLTSPGFVMVNHQICSQPTFGDYKKNIKGYMAKGCSTILVPYKVNYKREITTKIKKARHIMDNSSIDYVMGLHIPAEILDPIVVRKCKRLRVPFILVEIKESTRLSDLPWGWIKEALFYYNLPIYPSWKISNPKIRKEKIKHWEIFTSDHGIQSSNEFPKEHVPVNKEILKQIGVYPLAGDLMVGGDVTYNLFEKDEDLTNNHNPIIHVLRGRILKAGNELFYYPGYGKEITIKVPGHFITI